MTNLRPGEVPLTDEQKRLIEAQDAHDVPDVVDLDEAEEASYGDSE